MKAKEWKLKALTPIWTGGVNQGAGRLIPTGVMGSIRWWFEVLVRGLGGKACDPTAEGVRCPDENKDPHRPGHRCVVCELFGCTGWARKFRLVILDENGQVIQNQIRAGQHFILRFIPLRPILDEEWCLLDATLRLIADYGAIGGKTVFKPSDDPKRQNRLYHQDFGLVVIEQRPGGLNCSQEVVESLRECEQPPLAHGLPRR
jgi:CRISPR-associated protein Cmr1